jgi:hypothetical protein
LYRAWFPFGQRRRFSYVVTIFFISISKFVIRWFSEPRRGPEYCLSSPTNCSLLCQSPIPRPPGCAAYAKVMSHSLCLCSHAAARHRGGKCGRAGIGGHAHLHSYFGSDRCIRSMLSYTSGRCSSASAFHVAPAYTCHRNKSLPAYPARYQSVRRSCAVHEY